MTVFTFVELNSAIVYCTCAALETCADLSILIIIGRVVEEKDSFPVTLIYALISVLFLFAR